MSKQEKPHEKFWSIILLTVCRLLGYIWVEWNRRGHGRQVKPKLFYLDRPFFYKISVAIYLGLTIMQVLRPMTVKNKIEINPSVVLCLPLPAVIGRSTLMDFFISQLPYF